jgi:hypothetical protein
MTDRKIASATTHPTYGVVQEFDESGSHRLRQADKPDNVTAWAGYREWCYIRTSLGRVVVGFTGFYADAESVTDAEGFVTMVGVGRSR